MSHSLTYIAIALLLLFLCYIECNVLIQPGGGPVGLVLPRKVRTAKPWLSANEPEKEPNLQIINGVAVKTGGAPYQVALFRSGSFICGGSLITADSVLTAAHCVYGHEGTPTRFTIRYATLYRNSGSDLTVTRIIRHPQYSSSILDYDVAILLLSAEFTPGVNAAIIPLATTPPTVGSAVVVTGWGSNSLSNSQSLPLYLQMATNLSVLSQADCTDRWGGDTITERMVCAFSKVQSTCNGDSGGPMEQNGVLVGVVSWGSSWCLHPTHPSVYANVANLRTWILNAALNPSSNGVVEMGKVLSKMNLLNSMIFSLILYRFFMNQY